MTFRRDAAAGLFPVTEVHVPDRLTARHIVR